MPLPSRRTSWAFAYTISATPTQASVPVAGLDYLSLAGYWVMLRQRPPHGMPTWTTIRCAALQRPLQNRYQQPSMASEPKQSHLLDELTEGVYSYICNSQIYPPRLVATRPPDRSHCQNVGRACYRASPRALRIGRCNTQNVMSRPLVTSHAIAVLRLRCIDATGRAHKAPAGDNDQNDAQRPPQAKERDEVGRRARHRGMR